METIHIDSYDASIKDKHPSNGAETAQHDQKRSAAPPPAPTQPWYARLVPAGLEVPRSLGEAREKATTFARERPGATAAAVLGLGVLLTLGLKGRPLLRMLGMAGLPLLQRRPVAHR